MARASNMQTLLLITIICGLLPVLIQGHRDENAALSRPKDFRSGRHIETRKLLHVRGDGKQLSLTPDEGKPETEAEAQNTTSPESPAGNKTSENADDHDQELTAMSFIASLDPRNEGADTLMMTLFWAFLLLAVILLFIRCTQGSNRDKNEVKVGTKKGLGIREGSVLVCSVQDREELVQVYESMDSEEVIDDIKFASKIIAAGPPKATLRGFPIQTSCMMLPIQPKGAVDLLNFMEDEALLIKDGTILTCTATDGSADVWLADTNVTIGQILTEEKVVAKGRAVIECGRTMIPLRPRGAVELDLFEVHKKTEDKEISAEWQMEQLEGHSEISQKLKELRLQKTRIMMEQATRTKKLHGIMEQMLEQEAELEGKSKPTDEEIHKQAETAIANADLASKRNILMAIAYAAPLVNQTQAIAKAIEESVDRTRERGKQIILEEGKKGLKGLQDVMGLQDMENVDSHFINGIDVPSLSAILASVLAPGQISILYAVQELFFLLSVIFVITDTVALITNFGQACHSKGIQTPPAGSPMQAYVTAFTAELDENHVYLWFFTDGVVHWLCFFIRGYIIWRLHTFLKTTSKPPKVDLENGENPLEALRELYEYYTSTGTLALMELDKTMSSKMLYMANCSVIFDICWLLYGTSLVWNTPREDCRGSGILILRARCVIFQVLCLFYILQLVVFILGVVAQSQAFTTKMIVLAEWYDRTQAQFFPCAKVVVHALMVRRSSDMVMIQMHIQKLERDRLLEKKEIAEEELRKLTESYEQTEEALVRLGEEHEVEGGRFQGEAALQQQHDDMHAEMIAKSKKFRQDLADRSVKATSQAEKLVEQWERGEGSGIVQALVNGEGLGKMEELMNQQMEANPELFAQAAEAREALAAKAAEASAKAAEAYEKHDIAGQAALTMEATFSMAASSNVAALDTFARQKAAELATQAEAASSPPQAEASSPATDADAAPLAAEEEEEKEAEAEAEAVPVRRRSVDADQGAGG